MSAFLLSLKDVSLAFGGPNILDNVSLSIEKGLRAAITGRNGEGKSTLMKVIAGELEPDVGEIVRAPGLKTIYVSQAVPADRPNDPEFNALSGGRRRKQILEEALIARPDLLLLDEPTNHLDCETIDWLEGMIKRQREMAVLIVTHDRRFLRRVATKILDLDRGELSGWECDYTTFVKRKAELLSDEAVYWERKSKLLAKEEIWIRKGVKARTTRNEGRVAALMKLREEFANRKKQIGTSDLRIQTAAMGGERVIKVEDLSFAYSDKQVVNGLTLDVLRRERIGITGPNGAGKTTLLKLLTGRLKPTSGQVTIGTNVQMVFFDQLREELNPELSVLDNMPGDTPYNYLARFLFTPERCRTPVKALSGGERARLLLAKLFMKPSNLIVMDEPTNDLDIETLELLEDELCSYSGTLLLVSHDREFMDNVVTSTLRLDGIPPAEIGAHPRAEAEPGFTLEGRPERGRDPQSGSRAAEAPSKKPARLTYKLQRELDEINAKMPILEAKLAEMEATNTYENYNELRAELDALENRWLEISEISS